MATYQVKNLQSFFPKSEVVSVNIYKLTSAGDNYGGALLAVDVTIRDKETKVVRLVAKVLPQNAYIQELFNSQQTFRNEVGFYQTIIPCLRQFQRGQGLAESDFVADFYGARFSLDPSSTKVDADGVLLIKNISDEGFVTVDRRVGFNLEQTRLVLEKLAHLHGTAYALKKLKPAVFAQKVEPFLQEYKIFDVESPTAGPDMINSICQLLQNDELSVKNMSRIKNTLHENSLVGTIKNRKDLSNGVFAGLVHSDMWINNIMVQNTNVKFVDFQLYEYTSLTRDIVFFLFTSVQLSVLKRHFDELVTFYYNNFIQFLNKLKCEVSELTLEGFLAEMDTMARKTEFFHIMLMLRPIYAEDQNAREVEDMKQEHFTDYERGKTAACEEKACYIVHEFMRRGWLY